MAKNHKVQACERAPVISVQTSRGVSRGNQVDLLDATGAVVASFLYKHDSPLKCGARVWMETKLEVAVR